MQGRRLAIRLGIGFRIRPGDAFQTWAFSPVIDAMLRFLLALLAVERRTYRRLGAVMTGDHGLPLSWRPRRRALIRREMFGLLWNRRADWPTHRLNPAVRAADFAHGAMAYTLI